MYHTEFFHKKYTMPYFIYEFIIMNIYVAGMFHNALCSFYNAIKIYKIQRLDTNERNVHLFDFVEL